MDSQLVPSEPGYYAFDPDMGWIRFEDMLNLMFYRCSKEPPCMTRIVSDPAEGAVI